jgi:hypothetical protein
VSQILEYEKKYRNIKVKVSDGSIITGQINIMTFARLSDYLKQSNDKFIAITCENNPDDCNRATIINKEFIIWAETWD